MTLHLKIITGLDKSCGGFCCPSPMMNGADASPEALPVEMGVLPEDLRYYLLFLWFSSGVYICVTYGVHRYHELGFIFMIKSLQCLLLSPRRGR